MTDAVKVERLREWAETGKSIYSHMQLREDLRSLLEAHTKPEQASEDDRLREALVSDLAKACSGEVVGRCESCMAPFFEGDEYVSDPEGVTGCWNAMSISGQWDKPCYAYRTGKQPACAALQPHEVRDGR